MRFTSVAKHNPQSSRGSMDKPRQACSFMRQSFQKGNCRIILRSMYERIRDNFSISTDPARLDIDAMHAYLSRAYWSEGIPRDIVAKSIQGSICFGLFDGSRQIGLARVITDKAT